MAVGFSISPSMISNGSNNVSSPLDANLYTTFIAIKNRIARYGYAEMCNYVQNNLYTLLTSAIDKSPRSLKIIADRDFLYAFNLTNLNISREYINRFNRVYKAYVANPKKNVIFDQASADLMYQIALKYNKPIVDKLVEKCKDLTEDNALWITINRFSSTDERRNIRRTVRAMQHMSQDFMDEAMITNIFAVLFGDQLTNLFCAVMTDKFDEFDDNNEEYVYSTVSNAILQILDTMSIDDIKDIIIDYLNELDKSGTEGRFSLYSINPSDFTNINSAIKEIEEMHIKIK